MTDKFTNQHFLVTGSSGYIGSSLTEELLSRGFYVTLLTSSNSRLAHPRLRNIKWSLTSEEGGVDYAMLDNHFPKPSVIFHLAHSWTNLEGLQGRDVNLHGSLALYEWAKINDIRFIFASSVSARKDALNRYGRTKYLIEQPLVTPYAVIARIGLVYGGIEASQWGLLCKIVGNTRILPMVDPWVRVQPIHLEEVVDALISIATKSNLIKKIYILASDKDISFGDFLKIISLQQFHRSLFILPVPSKIILNFLKLVPRKLIDVTHVQERIYGLAGIKKVENNEDLRELSLIVRDINISNITHGVEVQLAREAELFMKSIINKSPSIDAIEKYVFAIKNYHQGCPYIIPFWVVTPSLLKIIEPLPFAQLDNKNASELLSRLNLALGILESGDAAGIIYNYTDSRGNRSEAIKALILEVLLFPIRWLYWKLK